MPNLRSQRLEDTEIELIGSNGTVCLVTKAMVQAWYQGTTGNAATRKAATIALAKGYIEQTLGEGVISSLLVDLDYDIAGDKFSKMEIR